MREKKDIEFLSYAYYMYEFISKINRFLCAYDEVQNVVINKIIIKQLNTSIVLMMTLNLSLKTQ